MKSAFSGDDMPMKMLDVGAATGEFLYYLRGRLSSNCQINGLDLNEKLVKKLIKLGNIL